MPAANTMHSFKPPTEKQLHNEKALKIYCAFLCSLILFVVAAGWLCNLCNNTLRPSLSRGPRHSSSKAVILAFRKLENRAAWERLGRPSLGLVALVGIYLVCNITLSSTVLATYHLNHFASRFGWLAAANVALCVFFGLKNTPLALIATISHNQLNTLHRIVGYTTIILVLLHATLYTIHFGRQGRWEALIEPVNLIGIGAGISMLVLSMGFFRHRGYQIFYVSHIIGFISVVVLTGFHRPDWAKKLPVVMLFVASLWVLDRFIRAVTMAYNLVNNQATFFPLPDGGTRLLLKKPCAKSALPGSHCFLWIPRVHLYQVHPFTIVRNTSAGLELVIKSHKDFTKTVSELATQQPGCATLVSLDGPYGSLPDTAVYDKLILIAGGSGAAFTFGLMNRILNHSKGITIQSVDFMWAVKHMEHLSWFSDHLDTMASAGSIVNLKLYVTSEKPIADSDSDAGITDGLGKIQSILRDDIRRQHSGSVYKAAENTISFDYNKMNTEAEIWEALQTVEDHRRVLVATCGPKSLMDAVRDSAQDYQSKLSCRIDVHCEDFSS